MKSKRTAPYAIFAVTVPASIILVEPVLRELGRRGWLTKLVMSPSADLPSRDPAYDISFLPMSRAITPTRDLRSLSRWGRLLKAEQPDVVVGSTPKAATLSMLAAKATGIRHRVFLVRGARWDAMTGPRATLLRRIDQLTAASATDVVAVSPTLARLLLESGVTKRRPICLRRGGSKGVDINRFHPRPRETGRTPLLGFVGRLSADKGIGDLVTVYDDCRKEIPEIRLVIAGQVDESQPVDSSLIERIVDDPGIKWLGATDEIPDILPAVDVLVFPSMREGLPNAVIEAAACGVPTVGYRVTGVSDAIEDGVTGYLVNRGDVSALSQAVLRILSADNPEVMRSNARTFAVEWFEESRVVNAFVDYLEGLTT